MISEYLHIVTDPAHVAAELTFVLVFDVLVGALLWPFVKRFVRRHDAQVHDHLVVDVFSKKPITKGAE